MKRPVIVSFLWPKNYPVLLGLAARGKVDIAAPVTLVPGAMASELAKSESRLIPLISSNYAGYAAAAETDANARFERIRKRLPELLATPAAANPQSIARSVALLEEALPATLKDSMAMIDELDVLAEDEDILAVLVNETDLPAGKLGALWAKQRGIPSFLFSHGGNIGTAYTITNCMYADYLFVFSQRGTETYRDIGVPLDRMIVTGNPAWDRYPQVLAERARYRAEAYSRMNLRPGEPLIVFATIWNTKVTALLEANVFEKTVRSFMRGCKRLKAAGVRFNAVVKDRPSNSEFGKSETERIAREEDWTDYTYALGDMEAFVAAADLIVSHDSNVFVEAMMASVPSINLWTPSSWLIGPGYDVIDGMPMVQYTNDEALAEIMQAILTDVRFRETVVSQMERSLGRFHLAQDGKSTARSVDAVLQLMKPPSAPKLGSDRASPLADERARKLMRLVKGTPRKVLDVGSGERSVVDGLRVQYPDAEVVHLDVSRMQAADIGASGFGLACIDTVILKGALEELYDPLNFLIRLQPYLTQDAQVLACIPNARNLWLISMLIGGRWDRADGDLLDQRRVRFFTLKSAIELFAAGGFEIDRLEQHTDPRVPEIAVPTSGTMTLESEAVTLKAVTSQDIFELRALEFLLSAKPN